MRGNASMASPTRMQWWAPFSALFRNSGPRRVLLRGVAWHLPSALGIHVRARLHGNPSALASP